MQSVYRGSFATSTGSVWENGNGGEFPNEQAYAAITSNGSVISWGSTSSGGNLGNATQRLTSNVTAVFSNARAFAALKADGSVVSWGATASGGNSTIVNYLNSNLVEASSVSGNLSSSVTRIFSTESAFAALKTDGSVVTWGKISSGGNSTGGPLSEHPTQMQLSLWTGMKATQYTARVMFVHCCFSPNCR